MTEHLILARAIDGAITIDRQLNLLLDAYDFYTARYPVETPSDELELRDLQVSIKELGSLPRFISMSLLAWRNGTEPALSSLGLELNVLNELQLHMHSLALFFTRKGMDLEPYSGLIVQDCVQALNAASTRFGHPALT